MSLRGIKVPPANLKWAGILAGAAGLAFVATVVAWFAGAREVYFACSVSARALMMASATGIKPHEIRTIERLVFEHKEVLISAYHESRRNR